MEGDFSSLCNQEQVLISLEDVSFEIIHVSSTLLKARIPNIHNFEPIEHQINLSTSDYLLADISIAFAPEIEILSFKPQYILQQQPSDVAITIETRSEFTSCFFGAAATSDELDQTPKTEEGCVLPQQAQYLAVGGSEIASRTVQIQRRNLAITHAAMDSHKLLTVNGSGLNQLTLFGYGLSCLIFNENSVMVETAVAFSVTNQLLEC